MLHYFQMGLVLPTMQEIGLSETSPIVIFGVEQFIWLVLLALPWNLGRH